LVPTGKGFDFVMAPISVDALAELVTGQKFHKLGENGFARIHKPSPSSR
jgi:hypothetical protein